MLAIETKIFFDRLANAKNKLKAAEEENDKKLVQIKALSGHVEKLMAFVRVEASGKATALEEVRQLERQLLKQKRRHEKMKKQFETS